MPERAHDPSMVGVVRDGYDRIAEQYTAAAATPGPHPRHDWLRALLARLASPGEVLDIGCGAGVPTGLAIVEAGHHLTGIDLSPRQIDLARVNVPSGEFLVADATRSRVRAVVVRCGDRAVLRHAHAARPARRTVRPHP